MKNYSSTTLVSMETKENAPGLIVLKNNVEPAEINKKTVSVANFHAKPIDIG